MRCLRQAKIIASINLWLRHKCHQPQRDNCKFSHLTQREKGYSYRGRKLSTLAKTGRSRTGKGFPIPYRTGFSSPNKRDAAVSKRPKKQLANVLLAEETTSHQSLPCVCVFPLRVSTSVMGGGGITMNKNQGLCK